MKNFSPKSQDAFVKISPKRYKKNKANVMSAAGFFLRVLKEEIKSNFKIHKATIRPDEMLSHAIGKFKLKQAKMIKK